MIANSPIVANKDTFYMFGGEKWGPDGGMSSSVIATFSTSVLFFAAIFQTRLVFKQKRYSKKPTQLAANYQIFHFLKKLQQKTNAPKSCSKKQYTLQHSYKTMESDR